MNSSIGLLVSCGVAFLMAAAAFLLLRARLEKLLVELCGTPERAHFWSSFVGLSLTLMTMLGCMLAFPLTDSQAWSGEPMTRLVLLGLRTGLMMLLAVLGMVGFVLGRAISRYEYLRQRGTEQIQRPIPSS